MQYRPLEGVDASLILWWEKKVWGCHVRGGVRVSCCLAVQQQAHALGYTASGAHALEHNGKGAARDGCAQREGHADAGGRGSSQGAGQAGDVHHASAQGQGEQSGAAGCHGWAGVQRDAIQAGRDGALAPSDGCG